ncbi:MAG: hypothetical protein PW788_02755 [Micavibrio sp.]|nr:hypothetical protein [Micavibrio sp.]
MKAKISPPHDMAVAKDLLIAAWQGDLAMVKQLYGTGANVGLLKSDILDIPELNLNTAVVEFYRLLNKQGLTERLNAAMHVAALRGHNDIVDFFIEKEAYNQRTLDVSFYAAVLGGELKLVKKLEAQGAHISFDAHASLIESIREKNYPITAHILQSGNGRGYAEALVAYIETDNLSRAEDVMFEDIDALQAAKAVCRQLSEKRDQTQNIRRHTDEQYLALLDNILSFAEGRGDDMSVILRGALQEAGAQTATKVAERVLNHELFSQLPDRQQQLDLALQQAGDAFAKAFATQQTTGRFALCTHLLELGASPDIGLQAAAFAVDPVFAAKALEKGADPRCDDYAALNTIRGRDKVKAGNILPAEARVLGLLEAAEKQLDIEDFKVFKGADAPLTENLLRSTDVVTGRTGLQLAAAAGEGAAIVTLLPDVTAAELLAAKGNTPSALDSLCRNGQAHLLQNAGLWSMREDDYAAVFAAFPVQQKQQLGVAHASLLETLKTNRDTDRLRRLRGDDKNRFRPK